MHLLPVWNMDGRQSAMLLAHGSFNPVHNHHFEMMVQARRRVEAAGFHVVRGILAFTNRDYVKGKGVDVVSDQHRLAALKIGCSVAPGPAGWLVPDARGIHYRSAGQMIKALGAELRRQAPGAVIFSVLGSDTAVRTRAVLRSGFAVVVCREGASAQVQQAFDSVDDKRQETLLLVDKLNGEECSSTKLRAALQLRDANAVRAMCPEPVSEYLLSHRDELYEESASIASSSSQKKGSQAQTGRHEGRGAADASATPLLLEPTAPAWRAPQSMVMIRNADWQEPRRRVVLVGVGGASGCGKSTLSHRLARSLGSPLISINADLYNGMARIMHPVWGPNYETPASVDFELLRADVHHIVTALAAAERLPQDLCVGRRQRRGTVLRDDAALPRDDSPVFVVVEGFLLFHDAELARMCNVQIWLEADCQTCMVRRYHRKQTQKKNFQEFGDWYCDLVWKNYLDYRPAQLANAPGALRLHAEDGADTVTALAIAHIGAGTGAEAAPEVDRQVRASAETAAEVAVRARRWSRR